MSSYDLSSLCGRKISPSAWRKYCNPYLQGILVAVDSALPPSNEEETDALSTALGNAARLGKMPFGFGLTGACAGYTRNKLLSRCGRVADALVYSSIHDKCFWLTKSLELFFFSGRPHCEVISIGGGPAFDLVALSMLSDFLRENQDKMKQQSIPIVVATVLDYELGWDEFAVAVASSLQQTSPHHQLAYFGKCDITKSLSSESNYYLDRSLLKAENAQIFVISYVVAENASALKDDDYSFFRDLFLRAPASSLFIFCETTHRLWPDILRVAFSTFFSPSFLSATADLSEIFEVEFPTRVQHGSVMLFSKPSLPPITNLDIVIEDHTRVGLSNEYYFRKALSEKQNFLLDRFERDNLRHIKSLSSKTTDDTSNS